MTLERDNSEERALRVDKILEELRLNTEDLHNLAQHAQLRAATDARVLREKAHRRPSRMRNKR